MTCCERAITTYIIKESLLIRGMDKNVNSIVEQMIDGAGISMNNPEDMAIIKEIGAEAMKLMEDLNR